MTPWTATRQASLSITNSRSLFKLMSVESVMSSNHLILCCPLLLLPSFFPSIRVFSSESVLCIRWPKHWSFSFSISPTNEYSGLIFFTTDWIDVLEDELIGSSCSPSDSQESSPPPQFKSINSSALSFLHSPTLTSIHDHWKNHYNQTKEEKCQNTNSPNRTSMEAAKTQVNFKNYLLNSMQRYLKTPIK